jgi:hypothetical protein
VPNAGSLFWRKYLVARRMQPPPERHVDCVSTGSFRPVHAPVSLAEHIVVVGFGITWGTGPGERDRIRSWRNGLGQRIS